MLFQLRDSPGTYMKMFFAIIRMVWFPTVGFFIFYFRNVHFFRRTFKNENRSLIRCLSNINVSKRWNFLVYNSLWKFSEEQHSQSQKMATSQFIFKMYAFQNQHTDSIVWPALTESFVFSTPNSCPSVCLKSTDFSRMVRSTGLYPSVESKCKDLRWTAPL